MRGLTLMTIAATGLMPVAVHAGAPAADPAEAGIRAAMADSAKGWDEGDLNRFVAIYAADAVFVGKNGLIRGKAAITENYRRSFTDNGNERGRLRFDFLALKPIGERRILFARWNLSGGESGMTTLVFEHRAAGWRIVADHSS
jgi:ketosteroid isomerase-like protein